MSDYEFAQLVREGGMYPQHRAAICWGCGGLFVPEDRCYADAEHVWHSRCWPYKNHELAGLRSSGEGG